jgi:hypothetical protein
MTDTSEEREHESGGEAGEDKAGRNAVPNPVGGDAVPLFMTGSKEGRKGDAQDEKDEVGE